MTSRRIFVDARVGWGSGIGRYISNLIPLVAAMKQAWQFDIYVMADNEKDARLQFASIENVTVRPIQVAPFSLNEQLTLPRLGRGYDLCWFTNYWVPQRWNGAFIATVHDLLHLRSDLFPASRAKRWFSSLTFHKLYRDARGLLFISRFTQREFEARFGAVARSCVHYNGVDHQQWPPFEQNTGDQKEKLILAVGASKKHKNFDIVFEAWSRANLPEGWSLVVVSPDAALRSSIDLSALSGEKRPVELRRGVSNEELQNLYARASIFLMPSLYEGFGIPLLEAFLAGAYCISSTADALVEIAGEADVHFVNGRDVEGWTAALEHISSRIEQGDALLEEGRVRNAQYARTFMWKNAANRVVQLMDQVI